ncbi:transporter substrate-binding domain-containing protein [Paenalcaligenes hermetiae]|uniref:Transporter substrate-binding domain-containing protein n=1 Tax=Paenalcaligenes hermetiae TaxID=1157987 RepID=A0ABP9M7N7_9BURK
MCDPIYVGVLFSTSGLVSTIEQSQLKGTLFAIEQINAAGGIHGREIIPKYYNPGSSPGNYRVLAETLFQKDQVNVIFGGYKSSTRKAMLPVVEKWNKLLFYPTLYEGFECSKNIIYTGSVPNQNSVQLAEYLMEHYGPRVYLIGSDYIYPHESNRIMSDLIYQHPHGEKLAERYVPLNATLEDFRWIIQDIKHQQPDFIFSTVVGNATTALYQAYAKAKLDPYKMPIASLTTQEVEIAHMGADLGEGHIASAPYFQSLQTATNQQCLQLFRACFGPDAVVNAGWEAAYFQVHLYANALRQAQSEEIEQLLPALLKQEFHAPQGKIRIDPDNHHTYLQPRIGIADANGQFRVVWESPVAIKPDPYLVTHTFSKTPLSI